MKVCFAVLAACAGLSVSTVAFAQATVDPGRGGFLISRGGSGFTRSTRTVQLGVGDRVAVSQGNTAQITYPDGCTVSVVVGAVQVIAGASPCSLAARPVTPAEAAAGVDPLTVGLIAAGAVGAGVGVFAATRSRKAPFVLSTPASP